MFRGAFGVTSTVCAFLAASAAGARVVHFSGFEGACSAQDVDADRLGECEELALKLDPARRDTDGDGLDDGDEVRGTTSGLDLPALGVDPRRKNILVEYDWFVDALEPAATGPCSAPAGHSHQPTQASLDMLTVAFAAAPVANPDGTRGIDILHDIGQGGAFAGGSQVPELDGIIDGSASGPEFFQYYQQYFALNRRGYFHYVLMPHRFKNLLTGKLDSSGSAQVSSGYRRDRIIVSLNCQQTDHLAGNTIMHELGHNLGLRHGGDSECNYKPNYDSVLNYRFQRYGVDVNCDLYGDGVADYSRGLRPDIDENSVDERKGVCGNVPVDFTAQNGIEASVVANLNKYAEEVVQCGAELSVLRDHDDWAAIAIGVDATVPDGGGGKPLDDAIICGAE
jgi:hypothetical protein